MSFFSTESGCRHPFHCIVPEYLLDEMSKNKDAKIREAARRSMEMTKSILSNRQAMAQLARFESAATVGSGTKRSIYSADNTENLRHRFVRREGDGPSGDSAVDDVYDFFGNTYDFYKSVFNRESVDGSGLPLVGTVHIGVDYNNAFWDGREMGFGDGDGVLFSNFTKSLDVIGHELSHAVVQFNGSGGLLYRSQSGSNESIADVFGVLVKQHYLNQTASQADWLLGAEIMVAAPSLRNMKDPHLGLGTSPNGTPGQPKHMDEYDNTNLDRQGVHINSGIPNHAFYLFATRLGGNAWLRAGQIWYDTLTNGQLPSGLDSFGFPSPPFATFQMFAEKTVSFTNNAAERNALAQSWDDVGIKIPGFVPGGTGGGGGQLRQQLEAIRDQLDSVIGNI